ncbi:rhodanese-like domain-containing protein [Alienimonas californiensis]|uniref:Inner membrane protein YgaP n=1 Tax=Alienimonas californiensis TaxID=2527989 RepID=A0A517P6F6_9PLAN|nr:rhodanese-like domain-containing protein [Alienimonas californiensis]QDT14967.1 Inner membrane protein YgaP [Alienimonas californiensis]
MSVAAASPAAEGNRSLGRGSISPHDAAERLKQGGVLIDVRTGPEYRGVHAEGARNVPLDRLDPALLKQELRGDGPILAICQSGARSVRAVETLRAAGLEAISVDGGTPAWESAGLPVARGKKSISLERQVRIAAGSLVLIGSILALTAHPYWAGLPAFVGAGLTFAGLTDTCGMGLLLAKMPWNR